MKRILALTVFALGAVAFAQAPPNDLCANALPVFNGVNPNAPLGVSGSFYTNSGATTDGSASCTGPLGSSMDVWFSYAATASGVVVIHTCNPSGAQPASFGGLAVLSVYSSCGGQELACDGSSSTCTVGYLDLAVTAGATYLIRVASAAITYGGPSSGTFYLTIVPPAPTPSNDLCANAIPVINGLNFGPAGSLFRNAGAGTEGSASCAPGTTRDVWFTYTASTSGVALIKVCNPTGFLPGSGHLIVSVLASCGGPEIGCASLYSSLPCSGIVPQLAVLVTAGMSYVIRVASAAGLASTFYLTIIPPGAPPANDACVNAIQVFNGINPTAGTFSNANATPDGAASCSPSTTPPAQDVWFYYIATGTGIATFTTATPLGYVLSNARATQIAVFTGCIGTEIACSPGNTVTASVLSGTAYLIRVASAAGSQGVTTPFYLSVLAPAPPSSNDECTGATPIVPGSSGPFTNATATTSPGLPQGSTDLWYSFTTGPCPGSYSIDTCSNANLLLQVSGACGGPVLAAGGFDSSLACGGARVTFTAAALTAYVVRVIGPPGWPYAYNLNISAGAVTTLTYGSPFGPSSIQANLSGLPPSGLFYLAVTLNQGAFPAGALYGIDILSSELTYELTIGPPFLGSANFCGNAQLGPFFGGPSGTTIYSVLFGFNGAYSAMPAVSSLPVSYTIP